MVVYLGGILDGANDFVGDELLYWKSLSEN